LNLFGLKKKKKEKLTRKKKILSKNRIGTKEYIRFKVKKGFTSHDH